MNFKTYSKKLGYTVYSDDDVIEHIPQKINGTLDGTLEVFTIGKYISDDDLEKEYAQRGLVPADPFTVANYLKDSEEKYLATHWKDADGNLCYAAFYRWHDERYVSVYRLDGGWDVYWLFAGLRKSALGTSDTQNSLETVPLDLASAIEMCKKAGFTVSKIY